MILDFLFGKKKETEPPGPAAASPAAASPPAPREPKPASGTHIQYHPELVPELKADHQLLLAIYGQIDAAYRAGNLAEATALLEKFRDAFMAHLLKENVRFYIYLEHALVGDPTSHALVHQFRHEMDKIGRTALAFLDKYRQFAGQPALAESFGADLTAIGKVLAQRIHNEEEALYPLYLPAY
jgi:hypothetical protein